MSNEQDTVGMQQEMHSEMQEDAQQDVVRATHDLLHGPALEARH